MNRAWKRLLAVALSGVMLLGTAIAASAAGADLPDSSASVQQSSVAPLPETESVPEDASTEPVQQTDVEQPEAAEKQNIAAGARRSVDTQTGLFEPFADASANDLLQLRPAVTALRTAITTGESVPVTIDVTPADGVTYTNVEFLIQAEGLTITPYSSAVYPNVQTADLGDGLFRFTVKSLSRGSSGDIVTAFSFKVGFESGVTPAGSEGKITLVSVASGGVSADTEALLASGGQNLRPVFTAVADTQWTYSEPGAAPEVISLASSAATNADGALPAAGTFYDTMFELSAMPSPASGGYGYLNVLEMNAQLTLEYEAAFALPASVVTDLLDKSVTIPADEDAPFDLLQVYNDNNYPITVSVASATQQELVLNFSAQGGNIDAFSVRVGHNKVYYAAGLHGTELLPQQDFVTYVAAGGTASLVGEAVGIGATHSRTQAIKKDETYDADFNAQWYLGDIGKRVAGYYVAVDGGETKHGILLPSTGENYINRQYLTEADHAYDDDTDRIWFEITGIQNRQDVDITALRVQDNTDPDEMWPIGFRPAAMEGGEGQRVVLVRPNSSETLLWEDGVIQDNSLLTAVPFTAANEGSEIYQETVYLLDASLTGCSLRFEFDGIGSGAGQGGAAITRNPFVLVQAKPGVGATLTEKVTAFTNSLEIEADYTGGAGTASGTAEADVYFNKALAEDVSIKKTVLAINGDEDETLIHEGDRLLFSVEFTLPAGTDYIDSLILVDELVQNLSYPAGMRAEVQITRGHGTTMQLMDTMHTWASGSAQPTGEPAIYQSVKPVTEADEPSYSDKHTAYYFSGVLMAGDKITITYEALVDGNLGAEAQVKNSVYALTATNGSWDDQGGPGGGQPPVWVPGGSDSSGGGYTGGVVGDGAMYAAIDLRIISERGNEIDANSGGIVALSDENAVARVQAGLPFAQQDTDNAVIIVERPASYFGFRDTEPVAYRLQTVNGEVDESSAQLLTQGQDYDFVYYTSGSSAAPTTAENANYAVFDFRGLNLERDEVLRVETGVRAHTTYGQAFTFKAHFLANTAGGNDFDEPLYAVKDLTWGQDTEAKSLATSNSGTIPVSVIRKLYSPGTTTYYVTTSRSVRPQIAQLHLLATKSNVTNVVVGNTATYTVTLQERGSSTIDKAYEIGIIVDVLPLGHEFGNITSFTFKGQAVTGYHTATEMLDNGRQRVVITLDKPLQFTPGGGSSGDKMELKYTSVAVMEGIEVPDEGINDTNRVCFYFTDMPADKVSFYSSSSYTYGAYAKEDDSDEDYAMWWQGINGLDASQYITRVMATGNIATGYSKVYPGVSVAPEDTSYVMDRQGGVSVPWVLTYGNVTTNSSTPNIQAYSIVAVLPLGYEYTTANGDTTGKGAAATYYNSLGQQVVVWQAGVGGLPQSLSKSNITRDFTFYTDVDDGSLGSGDITVFMFTDAPFTSPQLGSTRMMPIDTEETRLLEGTPLGGKGVMNTGSVQIVSSIGAVSNMTVAVNDGAPLAAVYTTREDKLTYTMTLENTSSATYTNLAFANAMPAVGDTTVLSGKARGSAWAPELDFGSFVPQLDGGDVTDYVLYFSEHAPSLDSYDDTAGFWTEAAQWPSSQVPAGFKVEFGSSVTLDDGETLTLSWDMEVPYGLGVDMRAQRAVNSTAFRLEVGGNTYYNEPTAVNAVFETESGLDLEITKHHSYGNGIPVPADATAQSFTFRLYVLRGTSWRAVDLSTGGYSVEMPSAGEILADGTLQITVDAGGSETVKLQGLQEDYYRLEETSTSAAYTVDVADDGRVTVLPPDWVAAQNIVHDNSIVFTNTRVPVVNLALQKVVTDTTGYPRTDSFTLELQRYDGTEWQLVDLSAQRLAAINGMEVNSKGQLVVQAVEVSGSATYSVAVQSMEAGTYRLKEVDADETYWTVEENTAGVVPVPFEETLLTVTNTRKTPASLTLEKKLLGDVTPATFTFTLQRLENGVWRDKDVSASSLESTDGYSVENGQLVVDTTSASSYTATLNGLEDGAYRFVETGITPDSEYNLVSWEEDGVALSQGQNETLTLINQRVQPGTVTVVKQLVDVSGVSSGDFTFLLEVLNGGTWQAVPLTDGDIQDDGHADGQGRLVISFFAPGSNGATITGLQPGTYRLTEVGVDDSQYIVTGGNAQFTLTASESFSWTVTNTRIVAPELTVRKAYVGGDVAETFTLVVEEYTGGSWVPFDLNTPGVGFDAAAGVAVNGAGELEMTVSPGGAAETIIRGLPHGTYRVREDGVDEDWFTVGYSASEVALGNGSKETVTVTNTRIEPAGIALTKRLVDETGASVGGEFTFTLLREVGGAYTEVDLTGHVADAGLVQNGKLVLDFAAPGEKTVQITGLLPGKYKLEEETAGSAVYDVQYSEQEFTLATGQSHSAMVTNTEIEPGVLLISKALVDTTLHPAGGTFELQLQEYNGTGWTDVSLAGYTVTGDGEVKDDRLRVTLEPGESANARVEGLPTGTYRVVEKNVSAEEYIVAYSDGSAGVLLDMNTAPKLVVTNTRRQATTLAITKALADTTADPVFGEFRFAVDRYESSDWTEIDLNDYTLAETSAGMYIEPNTGYLVLRLAANSDATAYVQGLEAGQYRVREVGVDTDEYDIGYAPSPEAGIAANTVEKITVTNTRKDNSTNPPGGDGSNSASDSESDGGQGGDDSNSASTSDSDGGQGGDDSNSASTSDSDGGQGGDDSNSASTSDSDGGQGGDGSNSASVSAPAGGSSSSSSKAEGGNGSSSQRGSSSHAAPSAPGGGGGTDTPGEASGTDAGGASSRGTGTGGASSRAASGDGSSSGGASANSDAGDTSGTGDTSLPGDMSELPPVTPGTELGEGPDGPRGATGRPDIVVDENGGYGEPGDDYYIQPNGTVQLFGTEVPWGGLRSLGGWSLANLIMSIIALFTGAIVMVHTFVVRGKAYKDIDEDDLEEDEQAWRKRSISRKLVAAAAGILPMLLFLIVEKLTIVIMFTKWTPFILVLFLLHFALLAWSGYRRREKEQPEEQEA